MKCQLKLCTPYTVYQVSFLRVMYSVDTIGVTLVNKLFSVILCVHSSQGIAPTWQLVHDSRRGKTKLNDSSFGSQKKEAL